MKGYEFSTGLDGQTQTLWPVGAISRDQHGVFKDIRGRVVPAPNTRLGTALDSTLNAHKQRPLNRPGNTGVDDEDSSLIAKLRRLLPTLERMSAEVEASEAEDNAEEEQFVLDSVDPEADMVATFANAWYQEQREKWLAINKRNSERRSVETSGYQPVNAAARAAAKRAS